ncbi:hypothetical protein BDV93DRAFT_520423 [Ceratobasidium sp. AG-I]|nr:hypothetical protein BDV93DRAFT_520423 [Ceratobasidium sp. AG-I]
MEDPVQEFAHTYRAAQTAQYMSLVATTLIVYDTLTTLHVEVQHVWIAQWTYGRVAFHFNRIWCMVVLSAFVPINFRRNLSTEVRVTCIKHLVWYTYGLMFLFYNITGIMIMRAWVLYDRKKYVLVTMGLAYVATFITNIVAFGLSIQDTTALENPAPGILSGCHFHLSTSKRIWIGFLSSFVLNTIIFVVTVRRTWFLRRSGVKSPLITRLLHDGTLYYFANLASIILSMLLNRDHESTNVALGSGYLVAIHTIMCSRMALSLRTFEHPNGDDVTDIPMTEVGDNTEWRVPSSARVKSSSYVELEDGINQTNENLAKPDADRLEARSGRFTGLGFGVTKHG